MGFFSTSQNGSQSSPPPPLFVDSAVRRFFRCRGLAVIFEVRIKPFAAEAGFSFLVVRALVVSLNGVTFDVRSKRELRTPVRGAARPGPDARGPPFIFNRVTLPFKRPRPPTLSATGGVALKVPT